VFYGVTGKLYICSPSLCLLEIQKLDWSSLMRQPNKKEEMFSLGVIFVTGLCIGLMFRSVRASVCTYTELKPTDFTLAGSTVLFENAIDQAYNEVNCNAGHQYAAQPTTYPAGDYDVIWSVTTGVGQDNIAIVIYDNVAATAIETITFLPVYNGTVR